MQYLDILSALRETLADIAVGGGYLSLFLVTLFEGVPLAGVLVPGHVAVVAAGFLSFLGMLDVRIVAAAAILGAVGGDYGSFALGRMFGWPFIDGLRKLFFLKDSHMEKAKALLRSHTGKALIIGRFNPVTRGIMPFLVGANRLPWGKFMLFNALGACMWVIASIALGYALGLGYSAAAGYIGPLAIIAVFVGLLIAWGYKYVNLRFEVFRRYDLFVLGINLVSLYVLAKMVEDAFSARAFMVGFDVWASMKSLSVAMEPYGQAVMSVARWVSDIGSVEAVTFYGIAIAALFAHKARWRSAAIMIMSIGSSALAVSWMKEFFQRVRPNGLEASYLSLDPSFPSGHAVFVAAFFMALAYLVAPKMRSWVSRELFIAACALAVIAVGLSRVMLNAHWASDVIAGWSLGLFCATGSILLVRYVGALVLERYRTDQD